MALLAQTARITPLSTAVHNDKPRAITACAHKLARLICTLITKGEEYVDQGQAHYEERYRQRVVKSLTKRAEQLGFQLVPVTAAA